MALQTNGKPQTATRGNSIVEEFDDLVLQLRSMLDNLQGRVSLLTSDMQTVAEIATRVANVLDVDELLPLVAEEVKSGFDLHHVNIYLMDEDGHYLSLVAASGEEGAKLMRKDYRIALSDNRNIVARTAVDRQAFITNNTHEDTRFDFDDLIPGTVAKLTIPMLYRERVIGVIGVQSNTIDRFDETDIRVKTTLAEQIAGAIEGANTFAEVQRTQSELDESRTMLQSVLDSVPVRVFAKDYEGRYIFANKLFIQDAGLDNLDAIVGKTDFELPWADTEAANFRADDLEVMDNDDPKLDFEETQTHDDGSVIWVSTSKVPLHDSDGRVNGVLGLYQDITTRKKAEELQRQANLVVENSPAIAFRWAADENWSVAFVSENISQFGYTPEELISGTVSYPSIVHPDDLERVAQEVEDYTTRGINQFTQEYRIIAKDGQVHWTDDRTIIERDEDGNPLFYSGIVLDITDRKRAEERETLAYEIGQQLNTVQDPRELLQFAVDMIASALDYYHAHIYLYEQAGNHLDVVAGLGEAGQTMVEQEHSISYDATRSLVAQAARTLQPVLVQDVSEDPAHLPNPLIPDTQSEAALPLFVGSDLLGVLDVQSDSAHSFDEDEIQLLSLIASQLSVALSNARQLAETERRLRDIALANQTSRIINETDDIADMLEEVQTVISQALGADSAGYANYFEDEDMWRGVCGYNMTREFAVTLIYPGPAYPHGLEALDTGNIVAIEDVNEYEGFPVELIDSIGIKSVIAMPIIGRNSKVGVAFFNFASEKHVFTQSEIDLLDGISRQISIGVESKRFAATNLRLRYLVDSSQDLLGYASLQDQTMLYVNQGGLELMGREWNEIQGTPINQIHTEAAIQKVTNEGIPIVMEGGRWRGETELLHKDGTVIPVEQEIYLLFDDNGNPVALGTTMRDLREAKEAEAALQRQAENFRALVENAPEAIVVVDGRTGNFLQASQSAIELFGSNLEDMLEATPADFAPEIQPDGRSSMEIVVENIQRVMAGETTVYEWQVINGNGEVLDTEIRSTLMPDDESGRPRIRATVIDVTARKEAERERNRVYNLSIDLIGTAGYDGYFRDINPAWERMLGFTTQELMSKPFIEFVHPDDVEKTIEEAQKLTSGEYDSINFVNRYETKNGDYRWLSWNATQDVEQEMYYFIVRDITEKREQEEERNRIYNLSIDLIGTAGFDGYFNDINPAWERMLGFTTQELMSKPFIEFVHPDDVENTIEEAQRLTSEEYDSISFTNRYQVKDGGYRWLSWNATQDTNREMYYFIVRDITEQRERDLIIEQRAAELETVAEVTTQAANTLDLDEMLLNVVELTKERFDLYHAHIYLLEDDALVLAAGAGVPGKRMTETGHRIMLNHPNSVVAQAARTSDTSISNDVTRSETFLPNPLLPRTRSELAVPLVYNREVIGVLDVQSTRLNRFSDEDAQVQFILAGQIAVAIRNAQAFQAEQSIRRENERVAQISAALSAAQTEQDILEAFDAVLQDANASMTTMNYPLDSEGNLIEVVAMRSGEGSSVPLSMLPKTVLSPEEIPMIELIRDDLSKPFLLESAEQFPGEEYAYMREYMEHGGIGASILVPLLSGDRWIGLFSISFAEPQEFDDSLIELLERIRPTLTSTVATRRSFLREQELSKESDRRARELETVAQVTTASSTILEVDTLLKQVSDLAKSAFGLYHAHIYLFDDEREILELAAGAGDAGEMMKDHHHSIPLRHDTSIVAQAARDRRGVRVDDVTLSPTFLPNPLLPETRSEMALPMIVGSTLVGVLDVQSDVPGRFDDNDLRIKSTLAGQIAVAVQNALAYEESQMIAERLREVDRLKSQFLASMSHELRTPLNSIIGYSEVLLDGGDGDLTEDAVEDVEIIYTSGRHLLAIINDILDLAKIEANQMKLHKEPTDLVKILRDVIKTNQVLVTNKPIELELNTEVDELIVPIDDLRIRQVVLNLFSNAVKFTEQGSVTIELSMMDDETARVAVIDTGIGISEEGMKIVFDQFRQVDGSSTRKAGGTGLGLTITRYLVEMHGGEIHVESEEDDGTTFWFTLPLIEREASAIL